MAILPPFSLFYHQRRPHKAGARLKMPSAWWARGVFGWSMRKCMRWKFACESECVSVYASYCKHNEARAREPTCLYAGPTLSGVNYRVEWTMCVCCDGDWWQQRVRRTVWSFIAFVYTNMYAPCVCSSKEHGNTHCNMLWLKWCSLVFCLLSWG